MEARADFLGNFSYLAKQVIKLSERQETEADFVRLLGLTLSLETIRAWLKNLAFLVDFIYVLFKSI